MTDGNGGQQEEKVFCGTGRSIQTQYGELLKLSFTSEDLKKMEGKLENGWVNVLVKKRRTPSESGLTHYLEVDNWKPDPSKFKNKTDDPKSDSKSEGADVSIDDLPF
jgi:hypothetical protein